MNDHDHQYIEQKVFARIGQKAIVVNSLNQILILQRSEKSGAGGQWSIPGGALEYGEDPVEGIKREIREETTLEVSDIHPFILFSRINDKKEFIVMIGYVCHAESESITLNVEHDAFKWLTKEQALGMDLTIDGRYFIEHTSLN